MRAGETNGVDYHFVTDAIFDEMIKKVSSLNGQVLPELNTELLERRLRVHFNLGKMLFWR